MVIAASLAVGSNVLLVYALQSTGLSVLGPINAYKSVISLVLGIFLLGEIPAPKGLAGVLLIVAGSYFVVDRDGKQSPGDAFASFFRERGIQFRFAALALSATEAIFLKKALLLSSPLTTFVFWSILGLPIAATALVLLRRRQLGNEVSVFRHHWPTYLRLASRHRRDATDFAADFRQAASRLLPRPVSTIHPDQRFPGSPLLPGRPDSQTTHRIGDHGCRRRHDRSSRPSLDIPAGNSGLDATEICRFVDAAGTLVSSDLRIGA